MVQLSGTATVDWGEALAAANFAGAKCINQFNIDEILELPTGSHPIQWESQDQHQLNVQVIRKVKESSDATSFYLSPVPGDPPGLQILSGRAIYRGTYSGREQRDCNSNILLVL